MSNKSEQAKQGTVAEQIWEEIKEKQINLFALPGQSIEKHVKPVLVEPSKLYVVLMQSNASSVLTALEVALSGKYTVELAGKYICIARVIKG